MTSSISFNGKKQFVCHTEQLEHSQISHKERAKEISNTFETELKVFSHILCGEILKEICVSVVNKIKYNLDPIIV
jgi:hypothetical protein